MNKLAMLLALLLAMGCHPTRNSGDGSTTTTLPTSSTSAESANLPGSETKAAQEKPGVQTAEALPRRVDNETAVSPVYAITSHNCQNRDEQGSEGDEFVRQCKGYDNYSLWASGFEETINYRIESDNPNDAFFVMLAPLETGEAGAYIRADQFTNQLDDKIEWRLDEGGKPYAVIIRVVFYKNQGSAKKPFRPENKAAEFFFVRGLVGYESLQVDIPTTNTPYNPLEQARLLAYQYYERNRH